MRIRVEPKEFFMYSVFLAFNAADPEPEDETVKAYLTERELEPKSEGKNTWDGQEFDVMYFGGCYLGKHLNAIEDIQRAAVEEEMLAEEIGRILKETTHEATRREADAAPQPRLKELIAGLAQEFHQESSFDADEEGSLKVTLEPELIEQKFLERVAG